MLWSGVPLGREFVAAWMKVEMRVMGVGAWEGKLPRLTGHLCVAQVVRLGGKASSRLLGKRVSFG